jgi:hypothetical protein
MTPPIRKKPHCFTRTNWNGTIRFSSLLILFLLSALPLLAQKKDKDEEDEEEKSKINIYHSLEGGVTLGGQLSNEVFVYKSGLNLLYTIEAQFSSRVFYGAGLGVDKFNEETFYPLFASFRGLLRKKDNTPFLAAHFGYAFATNRNYNGFEGYDFDGGVLFSPGLGYRFSVGDKFSGLLGVYYKHQFAKSQYRTYDGFNYRTTLNYDLVSFRAGIMF